MTRQYDNYADLITFSRSSGGTALRPISYGDELVTNGTFDTDTDWAKGTGWTIGSGVASCDGTQTVATLLAQSYTFTVGRVYLVSYEVVSRSAGSVTPVIAGVTEAFQNSSGVYTTTIIASGNDISFRANDTFVGSIDNISVKEVLFDQPNAPLTLFNHPAGIPRIEYDADGNVLGLLVEESRTNLVTYSDISNAAWGATRATKVTEAETSPAGTIDAVGIVASTNNDSHYLSDSFTVVSGSTYTASAYLKAGTKKWATLYNGSGNSFFDLENGVVGFVTGTNNTTAKIQDVGNGWYRCSISFDAAATSYLLAIGPALADEDNTYIGDNVSEEVYIYGAQLEAGAFPTSYIPTAGATATRSADVASIPVADFGYNQSEGTVVVEFDYKSYYNSPRLFSLDQQSNANFEMLGYVNTGGVPLWFVNDNGVTQANSNSGVTLGSGGSKAAVAYAVNDCAISVDGSSPVLDGLASIPTVDQLRIGREAGSSSQLNGHIKSIKYYPRRLSNAQLVELTS